LHGRPGKQILEARLSRRKRTQAVMASSSYRAGQQMSGFLKREPDDRGDREDSRSDTGRQGKGGEKNTLKMLTSRIGWEIGGTVAAHSCNSRGDFRDYRPMYRMVATEDGLLPAHGRGNVYLEWLLPDGSIQATTLCNVWHVPTLQMSCISKSTLQHAGAEFSPGPGGISIVLGGVIMGQALWQQGLPILSVAFPTMKIREAAKRIAQSRKGPASLDTWHRRMNHLGHADVCCLADVADGVEIDYNSVSDGCDVCATWKKKKVASQIPPVSTTHKLQVVHADIYGPINPPSICGSRYYVVFTDDFTRIMWLYFIRDSSQCVDIIKNFLAETENRREGTYLKTLRYTGSGEFGKLAVRSFLAMQGIGSDLKPSGESANPMLMETALYMLQSNKLPDKLWVEALSTVAYLRNRSPTGVIGNGMTPFEAWFHRKPDLGHVRVFGSPAYADSLETRPGKELQGRSVLCYLLGYQGSAELGKITTRLWNPHTRRTVRSMNVVVDELVEGN
jgi:hypothetical protein